jgi:hypothetical protein
MKLMEYFEEWTEEKEAYKRKLDLRKRKRKRGESNKPIEIEESNKSIEFDEPVEPESNESQKSIEFDEPVEFDSNWRKYFLADNTHTNLRIGVAGSSYISIKARLKLSSRGSEKLAETELVIMVVAASLGEM